MSIVSANGLSMYYGAQDIFKGVSFDIAHGDKIALVGPNGAGKTTLLRIVLGLEQPVSGNVTRAKSLQMGYLPQHPELQGERTLWEEMLDVFSALTAQQAQIQAIAEQLAANPDDAELLASYAIEEQAFDHAGGYTYEIEMQQVLGGLGFDASMYDWPIALLSGGQVTRALLARLLLEKPNLLVLDEPTNYLDLKALEWLEGYLQNWPSSLVIVSHDRYFLDKVVQRVWELDFGKLTTFRGNYSAYLMQREASRERQAKEFDEQQEFIARTEEYIRRNKAGQRSREARGREKKLDHLERVERPRDHRGMGLHLHTALRSGDRVLMSESAVIGYAAHPDDSGDDVHEHPLFNTGEFLIQRGQTVALLGSNGSGKTTFIKTVLGKMPPLKGRLRLGASVRIGYLPQSQAWADEGISVLDQLIRHREMRIDEARALLGRFLFSGDDIYKTCETLSGGERARLALAMLTLDDANLLILDEPTTHLDLQSQEILQQALTNFPGTILMVSHDRYLVDHIATHVWYVRDGEMEQFEGTYSEYAAFCANKTVTEPKVVQPKETRTQDRREQNETRRTAQRAHELEKEIGEFESRLRTISIALEQASAKQDIDSVHRLGADYEAAEKQLAQLLSEWETVLYEDANG